jgi:hypothetical protein
VLVPAGGVLDKTSGTEPGAAPVAAGAAAAAAAAAVDSEFVVSGSEGPERVEPPPPAPAPSPSPAPQDPR